MLSAEGCRYTGIEGHGKRYERPRGATERRLHRLARYLCRYPEETWTFSYQDQPKKLELLADSDWAADRETRRSVSCLVERLGNHILEASVAKQTVVALSSGESDSTLSCARPRVVCRPDSCSA